MTGYSPRHPFFATATLAAATLLSGCSSCFTHTTAGEPMAMPRPEMALHDVYFGYDSAELTPTAKKTLQQDFENLGLNQPDSRASFVLEGRADERGDPAHNKSLSGRRLASVKEYLVSLGAPSQNFSTDALGEEQPIDSASGPEALAKNRSVRILVK